MNISQSIDTTAIKEESLRIKNRIDSLIKKNKTFGGISCGTKFSHELIHDSTDRKIKSILFYYPINNNSDTLQPISHTAISSYFEEEKVVFINIKYSFVNTEPNKDFWTIKFEQNIYINDSIQIKELMVGKFDELPIDVKELINNTL
ncbi:hypothetical protein [Robertkochia aurantiaca]|uniref:hypothetical protein n=1 Tax=Robertkochia aurantiaca TaxID=2873700 RepID=UPI001CCDB389|nr:hypothetical protein [Robertkochia sp. 3YJGBD-33]